MLYIKKTFTKSSIGRRFLLGIFIRRGISPGFEYEENLHQVFYRKKTFTTSPIARRRSLHGIICEENLQKVFYWKKPPTRSYIGTRTSPDLLRKVDLHIVFYTKKTSLGLLYKEDFINSSI